MARSKGAAAEEKKITKADMVRDAMAQLGDDAKPLAMQAHIQANFGKTLSTSFISNYKSQLKRRAEQGGGDGRKRGEGSYHIGDIEAVTGLVRRLGAAQVKRLVEAIG